MRDKRNGFRIPEKSHFPNFKLYKARNKNDNEIYAVKRVELPSDPEKRKKVKREMQANIQLTRQDVDMTNFIRYYQAWDETAPLEHIQDHDKNFPELSGAESQTNLDSILTHGKTNSTLPSKSVSKVEFRENGDSESLHWDGDSNGSWETSDVSESQDQNLAPMPSGESYVSKVQEIHGARLRKNISMDLRRNPSTQSDFSGIEFLAKNDLGERDSDFGSDRDSEEMSSYSDLHNSQDSNILESKSDNDRHFLYLQLQLCDSKTLKERRQIFYEP